MGNSNLPAIETFGLSKRYGKARKYAIHDLDLTIEYGEVYGFLGPNGAGKTTTIRLLMNFIQPTFGNGHVLGHNIVNDSAEVKSSVGYLSGDVALYPKMTGRQFLTYMAQLQRPKNNAYANSLVKLFQAELNKKICQLSKGNRQKIGLIQAFMHQPAVLILDEPTDGLDPLMQEAFYELVRQTKARGTTLFVSSHNLSEVQKMCDRVGFIRNGRLVDEQTIADISRSAVQTYDIVFAKEAPLAELRKLPKHKVKPISPTQVSVSMRGGLKPLLSLLAKGEVLSIHRREASLEDQFLRFYKGESK